MTHEVVIDCPHCAVRVKAKANTWLGGDISYFLVECVACAGPIPQAARFGVSESDSCNTLAGLAIRLRKHGSHTSRIVGNLSRVDTLYEASPE
jgi:hypothetical protein